jgi:hypothetical protein
MKREDPAMSDRYDDVRARLESEDARFDTVHREAERAHRAVMADISRFLREMREHERQVDESLVELREIVLGQRDEIRALREQVKNGSR